MKIINVVSARPNFMKIAPFMEQINRCGQIESLLVHTGQYYDDQMSAQFFNDLGMAKPDVSLEVGSGSHAVQTAEIMKGLEPDLHLLEPLGYLNFLKLTSSAKVVLTDSGGIQEETTILKVPCIALRENTERPTTAMTGSNQVVGTDTERILTAYRNAVCRSWREPKVPPLWDGRAAERIVQVLLKQL